MSEEIEDDQVPDLVDLVEQQNIPNILSTQKETLDWLKKQKTHVHKTTESYGLRTLKESKNCAKKEIELLAYSKTPICED